MTGMDGIFLIVQIFKNSLLIKMCRDRCENPKIYQYSFVIIRRQRDSNPCQQNENLLS